MTTTKQARRAAAVAKMRSTVTAPSTVAPTTVATATFPTEDKAWAFVRNFYPNHAGIELVEATVTLTLRSGSVTDFTCRRFKAKAEAAGAEVSS